MSAFQLSLLPWKTFPSLFFMVMQSIILQDISALGPADPQGVDLKQDSDSEQQLANTLDLLGGCLNYLTSICCVHLILHCLLPVPGAGRDDDDYDNITAALAALGPDLHRFFFFASLSSCTSCWLDCYHAAAHWPESAQGLP